MKTTSLPIPMPGIRIPVAALAILAGPAILLLPVVEAGDSVRYSDAKGARMEAVVASNPDFSGAITITPGQFHAQTVPRGFTRWVFENEYYSENYYYEEEDGDGDLHEFVAENFYEWTGSLVAKHGLTDHLEVGMRLPVIYGYLEKDRSDRISNLRRSREEFGLGNIGLLLGLGQSWNEESDFLMLEGELGLPTDTRSRDWFSGGGTGYAAATFEHYFNRVGFIVTGFTDYYAENGYGGGDFDFGYLVSLALEPLDRVFIRAGAGQQEDIAIVEGSVEWQWANAASVEFFGGWDVSGDRDAVYIGVGVNVLQAPKN